MAENDIQEKLAQLTSRQREILGKVCKGNDYKSIAEELVISEETVKAHVGNIYIKLGLDQKPVSLRRKELYESYCPELHRPVVEEKKDEPFEPVAVPQAIQEMVEHDEFLMLQPVKVIQINQEPIIRRTKWWAIALLVIALFLVFLGGLRVYEWASSFLNPVDPLPAQAVTLEYVVVTATSSPIETLSTLQATNTIPPTLTDLPSKTPFPPTLTPTPMPIISLPFTDNFDNGIKPEWKVLNGQWLTANGKLTITNNDGDFQMIMLDDPTWKNYKLTADVVISHPYSANAGAIAIGVHCLNNQTNFLGFQIDTVPNAGWSTIGFSTRDSGFISGSINPEFAPVSGQFEIEINGTNYIARVDGRLIQEINLAGSDHGGIILALQGWGDGPTIDNISIEPLP